MKQEEKNRTHPGAAGPSFLRRPGAFALPLLLCVPYALLVWRFWWVCDDAWISFRHAWHWAAGLGIRFNPGDGLPVEGYSNFLWVALCALVERAGADPSRWMPWLSFGCGVVLLVRVHGWLRARHGLTAAVLGTLALGCFPPYAVWSTSGLETLPFALALFVLVEMLLLRAEGPAPGRAALAALALALLRFEGVAWALAVLALAVLLHRGGQRRAVLAAAGGFLAAYLGYFLWRYRYYEALLPAPVHAKVGLTALVLERGVAYLMSYALTFVTPLVLAAAVPLGVARGPRSLAFALALVSGATLLHPVLVGGDFMAMGRFLVPGAALHVLLVAEIACRPAGRRARSLATALVALAVLVALLPAFDRHVVPGSLRARFHFRFNRGEGSGHHVSELAQWRAMVENEEEWRRIGQALALHAAPGDSVVLGAIGAIGYFSGLTVHDTNGLVTPAVARLEVVPRRRSPGHDKTVAPTFFLEERPTFLAVELVPGDDPGRHAFTLERWSELGVADLYEPVTWPLTDRPGRRDRLLVLRRRPA